jgi:hypothetical protein
MGSTQATINKKSNIFPHDHSILNSNEYKFQSISIFNQRTLSEWQMQKNVIYVFIK